MFIDRKTRYSALFTFWLGGMPVMLASFVQNIIFVELACPLNDVILCLHWEELTHVSINIDFTIIVDGANVIRAKVIPSKGLALVLC